MFINEDIYNMGICSLGCRLVNFISNANSLYIVMSTKLWNFKSIAVKPETWRKLGLICKKTETYDDVINRLLQAGTPQVIGVNE